MSLFRTECAASFNSEVSDSRPSRKEQFWLSICAENFMPSFDSEPLLRNIQYYYGQTFHSKPSWPLKDLYPPNGIIRKRGRMYDYGKVEKALR